MRTAAVTASLTTAVNIAVTTDTLTAEKRIECVRLHVDGGARSDRNRRTRVLDQSARTQVCAALDIAAIRLCMSSISSMRWCVWIADVRMVTTRAPRVVIGVGLLRVRVWVRPQRRGNKRSQRARQSHKLESGRSCAWPLCLLLTISQRG